MRVENRVQSGRAFGGMQITPDHAWQNSLKQFNRIRDRASRIRKKNYPNKHNVIKVGLGTQPRLRPWFALWFVWLVEFLYVQYMCQDSQRNQKRVCSYLDIKVNYVVASVLVFWHVWWFVAYSFSIFACVMVGWAYLPGSYICCLMNGHRDALHIWSYAYGTIE